MDIKIFSKLVKPVADSLKKVIPYAKTYGDKAYRIIKNHQIETGLTVALGAFVIDGAKTRKKLNKERDKNKLYQEALKKHQAEISALKTDLEREEYKNRLWEELKSKREV